MSYGDPEYWDERYASMPDDTIHEWYQPIETIVPILLPYCIAAAKRCYGDETEHVRILHLGCGYSQLSHALSDEGFTDITNVDISKRAIDAQRKRSSRYPKMKHFPMSARSMKDFASQNFDLVVDKALTDAILCDKNGFDAVREMYTEIHRVLKPGGVYASISHGVPESRLVFFGKKERWSSSSFIKIPKPAVKNFDAMGASPYHYVYFHTKRKDTPALTD